jgi:hypothetical protein
MFFRKRRPESEYDREIAFHIEQLTQAGIAEGLTRAEARRRALIEFGAANR